MIKKVLSLVVAIGLITCNASTTYAQSEDAAIKKSITRFFDGLAVFDEATMRDEVTDDFQLLEDGDVWTIDSLIVVLGKVNKTNFSRTNRIEYVKVEQRDNVAWVSYYNYANIKSGQKEFALKWLESAVLLKIKKRWRISLLHSTRLKT